MGLRGKIGNLLIVLGVVALLGAIGLYSYNTYDAYRAEQEANVHLAQIDDQIKKGKLDSKYYCKLSVPSHGLTLPVMKEWSYENLRSSACRYSGELDKDNLVICAHSYARHFGALYDIQEGTDVYLEGSYGLKVHYQVEKVEVLAPTSVDKMTEGKYDLSLFTCTYDSQSRFTIRCNRVE